MYGKILYKIKIIIIKRERDIFDKKKIQVFAIVFFFLAGRKSFKILTNNFQRNRFDKKSILSDDFYYL